MRTTFNYSLLTLIFILLGCSTQKDRPLNRGYHSLNTKFNVLFNGEEALKFGVDVLENQAEDNFDKILPVELITLNGEGQNQSGAIPSFTVAEEKAVKAIQKHSMNLNGVQKNSQIVNAYLLLGKARYYDGRFIPAIESFNYLLSLPSKIDVFYEGKLWREKTNIRLGNNQLAISNLTPLAEQVSQKNKHFAEINAVLAQAFLNVRKNDSALKYIKNAGKFETKKLQKARYKFIEAQLFERINQKDSARLAYNTIVNLKRKVPRIYWMRAKLNTLGSNLELDTEEPEKEFEKLARNFENQNFLHLIYRSQAQYYLRQKKGDLAKKFYTKSFQSSTIDQSTRKQNYRDLADDSFARGEYVNTGFYLDSLLSQYSQQNNERKQIARERRGLDEVIAFERTIKKADSILLLAAMSREEQLSYYQKIIDDKRAEELAKVELEGKSFFNILGQTNKNRFYFYNQNLVVLGEQDFATNFGNRQNVDNWNRIESLANLNDFTENSDEENPNSEQQDPIVKETAESYADLLPKDPKMLDSLFNARNQAYLEVGIIYKEHFKDNELAENRFQELLSKSPSDSQKTNAWYHLYKIEEGRGSQNVSIYKEKIITNYPESRFARILKNPDNFKLKENETPEIIYEKLYTLYLDQEYEKVLSEGDDLLVIVSGTPLASKVSYLMANAFGRLDGIDSWREKLELLVKEFPNSEEATQANKTLKSLANVSQDKSDEYTRVYNNYKGVFSLLKKDKDSIPSLINSITEVLDKNRITYKSITKEVYDREYIFLVISGLRDESEILIEFENEKKETLFDMLSDKFVLLSSEYRDIQLFKNWKSTNITKLDEK